MRLKNEALALIRCANLCLDEHDTDYIESLFNRTDFDWEKFWILTGIHKLGNILYSHLYVQKTLQLDIIPFKYRSLLKQTYMLTLVRNKHLCKEISNIATRFKEQSIKVMFLKGIVLCEKLYKDLGLRGFSDFDILVHQDNIDKSKTLLHDMGYIPIETDGTYLVSPHEKPLYKKTNNPLVPCYEVEIHRFYPYFGVDVSNMMDNVILDVCGGVPIYTLSEIDHVILLLIHLYQHLVDGYGQYLFATLNMFCEAKEYLKIVCKKNQTQELIRRVHELNAQTPVYVSLIFMNYVYNNFVSVELLEAVQPEENLRNQIGRSLGCGVYLPASYGEMVLFDRVKEIADYNNKLNNVGYGETAVLYIIDPRNISSQMAEEIADRREDKHEMYIPQISAGMLDKEGMVLNWRIIPSYYLPEQNSSKWHFFGGNLQEGASTKTLEELSMEFKVAWDMKYLHFYGMVNDASVVVQEGYECDGVTLNFYQDGHLIQYALFISASGKAQVQKAFDYSGWKPLVDTKARTSCTIHDGKGYVLKAAIPWDELGILPAQNKRLKFDIELVDFVDETRQPDTILVWSGGKGFGWKYPNVFGEMVLGAKDIMLYLSRS
jgi:hypothetical protein